MCEVIDNLVHINRSNPFDLAFIGDGCLSFESNKKALEVKDIDLTKIDVIDTEPDCVNEIPLDIQVMKDFCRCFDMLPRHIRSKFLGRVVLFDGTIITTKTKREYIPYMTVIDNHERHIRWFATSKDDVHTKIQNISKENHNLSFAILKVD